VSTIPSQICFKTISTAMAMRDRLALDSGSLGAFAEFSLGSGVDSSDRGVSVGLGDDFLQ